MRKIGVLTTHASINFGGLLQAYALRRTMNDMGYVCNIINYKPEMHNPKSHPMEYIFQRKNALSKAWFALCNYSAYKHRMDRINEFRSKFLCPVPDETVSLEQLPLESRKYDVICCGSDQLWNLNQKDNENRAYMLDFDRTNRSISYAVSFGDGLREKRAEIEQSLPLIRRFDAVSVREEDGLRFLQEHGIDAQLTLDPTLLAEKSVWEAFSSEPLIRKPYILVYGFENAFQTYDDLIYAAKRLSKELEMPVVNPVMTPALGRAGFENLYDCGPAEFLNLVENAAFVCTNSFHGCIFSILKERPFMAVTDQVKGLDGRKKTLLSLFGQEFRAVTPDGPWNVQEMLMAEYGDSEAVLHKAREQSRAYLRKAIEDEVCHE